MISPSGLIPDKLMRSERKQEVIQFVIAQPWPRDFKRAILSGWASWVGIRLESADFKAVEASGYDR